MERSDIRRLPDADWRPVRTERQSRYVGGLCELGCGHDIAPNELRLVRGWKHGPAEVAQHIECPAGSPKGETS